MILFLLRGLLYLASAALGLIAADLSLEGFQIDWNRWWAFLVCILIFAVLQSLLSPWIAKIADRYAPVLMGGIGIVSTLVSLIIVNLLPNTGLHISGALAWVLGSVIVWVITALGSWLLPLIFLRKRIQKARAN